MYAVFCVFDSVFVSQGKKNERWVKKVMWGREKAKIGIGTHTHAYTQTHHTHIQKHTCTPLTINYTQTHTTHIHTQAHKPHTYMYRVRILNDVQLGPDMG